MSDAQEGVVVTQADRELRKALLAFLIETINKPCTPGDGPDERNDELDRIIARHRTEATRQAGWQPIETVPRPAKRERKVDLLLGAPDGSMMIGFWNGTAWDDGDFRSHETWPTHWQPLPPPPALAGECRGGEA